MSILIDFLRAHLDEDERVALAAGGDEWPDSAYEMWNNQLVHARRHAPARVLREVEMKRRIVDDCVDRRSIQAFRTLELLARPYEGRDGWRTDWPTTPWPGQESVSAWSILGPPANITRRRWWHRWLRR